MPRKARIYEPGLPYHLVQRGNNRDACFFADDDLFYLQLLQENLLRYDVSLHSFVLMTNHIHLLLPPPIQQKLLKDIHSLIDI
jgi:putative transposase